MPKVVLRIFQILWEWGTPHHNYDDNDTGFSEITLSWWVIKTGQLEFNPALKSLGIKSNIIVLGVNGH